MEGRPIISTGYRGDNGTWRCYAQAREEEEQFIFYSVLDTHITEDRRLAVSEFLTRANYGLIIGNFELDFTDGEVRCKTSISVKGEQLTKDLIEPMVYINVAMMDRYMPGIMRVAYGGATPEEAIAEIEG